MRIKEYLFSSSRHIVRARTGSTRTSGGATGGRVAAGSRRLILLALARQHPSYRHEKSMGREGEEEE